MSVIGTPSRFPSGPAVIAPRKEAGHMTAGDQASAHPYNPLPKGGPPQMQQAPVGIHEAAIAMAARSAGPNSVSSRTVPSWSAEAIPAAVGLFGRLSDGVPGLLGDCGKGGPERTAQGYRRFRCRACGEQFNERSAGGVEPGVSERRYRPRGALAAALQAQSARPSRAVPRCRAALAQAGL